MMQTRSLNFSDYGNTEGEADDDVDEDDNETMLTNIAVTIVINQTMAIYGGSINRSVLLIAAINHYNNQECRGRGVRGAHPLVKLVRDFGGLSPLHQISLRQDKFRTTHLPKEKKGKARFYQYKNNATTLYLLSPSFSTFTYTGLTSTLWSYMQK